MSDGISIVVPVYNVPEKYLRACINLKTWVGDRKLG